MMVVGNRLIADATVQLLKVIHRHPGLPRTGKTSLRTAVRAIILQHSKLLMVFSPVNGDYKFPGGGVNGAENHAAALKREVLEECGVRVSKIGPAFGKVIEYDFPDEPGFELFQMTSHYYYCEIKPGFEPQRLDLYELELGFYPIWIDIDAAILANVLVLQSINREIPYWTARETFILQQISLKRIDEASDL